MPVRVVFKEGHTYTFITASRFVHDDQGYLELYDRWDQCITIVAKDQWIYADCETTYVVEE